MARDLPALRRTQDLVVEAMPDGDVLVYDLRTDQTHHLDADAARVWEHAGSADLAAVTGLDEGQVRATLATLADLGLVEQPGMSRRDAVMRTARVAAVAAATVPVIRSITAPTPAHADSRLGTGSPCTSSAQCASGLCVGVCT